MKPKVAVAFAILTVTFLVTLQVLGWLENFLVCVGFVSVVWALCTVIAWLFE